MSVLRLSRKRGAPFVFESRYIDSQGVAVDLTGLTLTSLIRAKDGSVRSTCLITVYDQATPEGLGRFKLEVVDTSNWVEFEILYWDIALAGEPTQQTVEIAVGRRIS